MIEMREKLDMLESYLPDEAGTPMIMKLNPDTVSYTHLDVYKRQEK